MTKTNPQLIIYPVCKKETFSVFVFLVSHTSFPLLISLEIQLQIGCFFLFIH